MMCPVKLPLVVFGSGGHAKVVLDVARRSGFEPVAILDDNASRWGRHVSGVPVVGGREALAELRANGVSHALIGLGANELRLAVGRWLEEQGMIFPVAVHPTAAIDDSVRIGAGTIVMACAAINADTRIGRQVIVNTGATVDHDCLIGDGVHIAPGVNLCGSVTVGERVLIGVGASVAPGRRIGDAATVGAGAVVINDIAPGITAVGVPARVLSKG